MAETFTYRVRDRGGALVQGTLEGDSVSLVVARLRELGYVPLSVDRKSTTGLQSEIRVPFLGGRVKADELATFSRQFATMIESGLTLLRALAVLAEQTDSPRLAEVLNEVRLDIEAGSSLSQALSRRPKVFPRLYVAMIRAGEIGGGLDMVLLQLADTLEKQAGLRRKVKSAMTYPVAVLCLSVLILTAMLLFVVPTFKKMFATLHGSLPTPTKILVDVSDHALIVIPAFLISVGALTYGFRRWIETPTGRFMWDRFKLRAPVFGKLVHFISIARTCRTLAALTKAGVPLLEGLEITKTTSGNALVARALEDVQEGVSGGEAIARRLSNHPVIPTMVTQMISVGEESGAVDTMLDKVASFYESRVEAMVASLTSLLEPVLIMVLGSVVGSMVIALYMPMFKIYSLPGLNG